nr:MAG TPA: hypothetical protein [Caudoviricetes sp.]
MLVTPDFLIDYLSTWMLTYNLTSTIRLYHSIRFFNRVYFLYPFLRKDDVYVD